MNTTRGFVIIKRCGKTIVAIFKVESKELELELELERQSNLFKTTLLVRVMAHVKKSPVKIGLFYKRDQQI